MLPPEIVDENWEEFVDQLVISEVNRGILRFDQLFKDLPGIWPPEVYCSLERLAQKGHISEQFFLDVVKVLREPSKYFQRPLNSHRILLPAPHPLDFDWRFTDATANKLLFECLQLAESEHRVAMIGSPSVFRAAIEQDYPRPLALLDANPSMVACLANASSRALVIRCDVTKESLPTFKASTIVADPPWYEEHTLSFIWAACGILEVQGHLLLSLPPIGTRPGIVEERRRVLEFAQNEMGLNLLRLEKGTLVYETPYFEQKALEVAGFYNLPSDWRRGDLAVFRFERSEIARSALCPYIVTPQNTDHWVEESVGGLRIRIEPQNNEEDTSFQDPSLISIVEGDILPSVSRRDPRRSLVNVWTSSNHVFACQGRNTLRYILHSLANGHRPEDALSIKFGRNFSCSDRNLVAGTVGKITELAGLHHGGT